VNVGLALPQYDYSVPGSRRLAWEQVLDWTQRADALGFGSVWLADHLFLSIEKYGGPAAEHFGYEPLTALAALARAVPSVGVGTLVLCAQLRPPAVLAKNLAVLDRLTGGRLTVGIGAGWFEPEYAAAGIRFERPAVRLAQLAETVDVVKGMSAASTPFTYAGRHVGVDGARNQPPPHQAGGPPVWVGGRGDRLLGVVAGHADGWNTVWAWTFDDYRDRLAVLARACDAAGRDPATVTLSVGLYSLVGEDEADLRRRFDRMAAALPAGVLGGTRLEDWRRGRLVGTVDEVREKVAGWAELGVTTLIAGLGALPFSVTEAADLDVVAAAVI
jgi:alkanesulfonate monooxygenase SsuD/methylene tetrahydromethanopterin reductase-like flavin-dependent oxidoreductase (luciferase family)